MEVDRILAKEITYGIQVLMHIHLWISLGAPTIPCAERLTESFSRHHQLGCYFLSLLFQHQLSIDNGAVIIAWLSLSPLWWLVHIGRNISPLALNTPRLVLTLCKSFTVIWQCVECLILETHKHTLMHFTMTLITLMGSSRYKLKWTVTFLFSSLFF